jgi:hypothetical protein
LPTAAGVALFQKFVNFLRDQSKKLKLLAGSNFVGNTYSAVGTLGGDKAVEEAVGTATVGEVKVGVVVAVVVVAGIEESVVSEGTVATDISILVEIIPVVETSRLDSVGATDLADSTD